MYKVKHNKGFITAACGRQRAGHRLIVLVLHCVTSDVELANTAPFSCLSNQISLFSTKTRLFLRNYLVDNLLRSFVNVYIIIYYKTM